MAPESGSDNSNTAMITGIAGGVAGLVVVAAFIVPVMFKHRKRNAAAMDSPLAVGGMSDLDL